MPSTLRVVNFSPDEVKELEDEMKAVPRPMGYPPATVPLNAKTNGETKYSYPTSYTDKTVISLYNTLSALVHASSPSPLSHSNSATNTNTTTFSSTYHDEYAQYLASLQAELDADTSSDDDDDDTDDMAYPYSYNVLEEPPRLAALARSREERHRVRFTQSLDRCHAWRLSTIEESASRSSCCERAEQAHADNDADEYMCDDRESSRASSDESFTTAYTTLDRSLSSSEGGMSSGYSSNNGSYSSSSTPLSNHASDNGFWKMVMSMSTKSEISLLESLGSKSTPSLKLDPASVEKNVSEVSNAKLARSSGSSAKRNSRHLKCLLKALKALRGGGGKS